MSVNKQVQNYLAQEPFIRKHLDVINYSKLARRIIKETDLEVNDFDAVLVSLRRFSYNMTEENPQVKKLLKETTVEIKTNMAVVIIEKTRFYEPVLSLQSEIKKARGTAHLIEGSDVLTLITEENFLPLLKQKLRHRIVNEQSEVVAILLKSPEALEKESGVMGYIYSLFAYEQINILETMSCWRDTVIVVEKRDMKRAVELLDF